MILVFFYCFLKAKFLMSLSQTDFSVKVYSASGFHTKSLSDLWLAQKKLWIILCPKDDLKNSIYIFNVWVTVGVRRRRKKTALATTVLPQMKVKTFGFECMKRTDKKKKSKHHTNNKKITKNTNPNCRWRYSQRQENEWETSFIWGEPGF